MIGTIEFKVSIYDAKKNLCSTRMRTSKFSVIAYKRFMDMIKRMIEDTGRPKNSEFDVFWVETDGSKNYIPSQQCFDGLEKKINYLDVRTTIIEIVVELKK